MHFESQQEWRQATEREWKTALSIEPLCPITNFISLVKHETKPEAQLIGIEAYDNPRSEIKMINTSAKCGAESKETTRIIMQIEPKARRARKVLGNG